MHARTFENAGTASLFRSKGCKSIWKFDTLLKPWPAFEFHVPITAQVQAVWPPVADLTTLSTERLNDFDTWSA